MDKTVSILVPVYKAEEYIEQCAVSLFEQTYKNIEYVFVNDQTPDNSIEVLERVMQNYPKANCKIIHNERNLGIAETRNVLLRNATGYYIYFVDSDDYIELCAIERLVDAAEQDGADVVRQCFYAVSNQGIVKHQNGHYNKKDELLSHTIIGGSLIESMPLLLIRRSLIEDNKLSFVQGINICEDWIMTIKLFYFAKRVTDLDDAFYYYRCNNQGSLTKDKKKAIIDKHRAIENVEEFLKAQGIYEEHEPALLIRKFKCKQAFLIDRNLYDLKKYKEIAPEADSQWRHYQYNRKQRTLFWLAEKRWYWAIRLIDILTNKR